VAKAKTQKLNPDDFAGDILINMSERENILGRIREALKTKAPVPGHHHPGPPPGAATSATNVPRNWLPKVGERFEDQLALFARNAADLKADFRRLGSAAEVTAALLNLGTTAGWKKVACHAGTLTDSICPALPFELLHTDRGYDANDLEACDAGISECDLLVAQTGTVVVTTRSAGGRALSVLPPHHVVLARRDQLVPDLPAAFEGLRKKYGPDYPSMISLITGPSRTGDIERILVLGAHGPKQLTILCF
jgi:L-lactate dehydrogenase complex protein LldG